MKKIILSVMLLAGCVAFANAQTPAQPQAAAKEQATATNEYKEVALTSLSEVVQKAVKTLAGETFDVKKVESDTKNALTKVTLANKKDKSEKSVILDKTGVEVKQNATPAQPAPDAK